jgi:DNA-directed RNA polymerase II subunit RPB2
VTGSNNFNPTGATPIEVDDGFEYDPSYSYTAAKDEPKEEEQERNFGYGEEEEDQIKQEDYWTIITTFFEEKGLVRQQLESFNEFVENTMQEIVDENARLMLDQHQQYTGVDNDAESVSLPARGFHAVADPQKRYEISFGQIYLSKAAMTEQDGTTNMLFPQEARLRNLTYSAPLYVEVKSRLLVATDVDDPIEADWKPKIGIDGDELVEEDRAFIGKVSYPIARYVPS